MALEYSLRHTSILAEHQISLLKDPERSQGDILEVSYGRSHNIKSRHKGIIYYTINMTSYAGNRPIIYIAREIERAMGREPLGGYFIITNTTSYALEMQEKYPDNIWLINSPEILDTYELLALPEVQKMITERTAQILVFKNTLQIERLCAEKNWTLLNPSAGLAEKIENKITQVEWLGELASLLPPHSISLTKDILWNKKAFILQWSHGHTGDGTILVQSEKDLDALKEKFPHREARVSDFIKGPMFTANIVVTNTVILFGNISYQITGVLPFTDNPFSTIGNDWSIPHTILSDAHIAGFEAMAQKIGAKMQKEGWKGLFGVDVIYDEERDALCLIEINARQPASATLESEFQSALRSHGVQGVTTFDAHLQALIGLPVTISLIPINDGAQIVQRLTQSILLKNEAKHFEDLFNIQDLLKGGYKVISYKNKKPNTDLLRIQSSQGIMEAHMKLNKRGKEIIDSVSGFQS